MDSVIDPRSARPSNHSAALCKRLRAVVGILVAMAGAQHLTGGRADRRAGRRTVGRSGRRFAPPSAGLPGGPGFEVLVLGFEVLGLRFVRGLRFQ